MTCSLKKADKRKQNFRTVTALIGQLFITATVPSLSKLKVSCLQPNCDDFVSKYTACQASRSGSIIFSALFQAVMDKCGTIDIVVCNVGTLNERKWRETIHLNMVIGLLLIYAIVVTM